MFAAGHNSLGMYCSYSSVRFMGRHMVSAEHYRSLRECAFELRQLGYREISSFCCAFDALTCQYLVSRGK